MSKKENELTELLSDLLLRQNEMIIQHNRERTEMLNRQANELAIISNRIKGIQLELNAVKPKEEETKEAEKEKVYPEDFDYFFNLVLDKSDSSDLVVRSSVRKVLVELAERTGDEELNKRIEKHGLKSKLTLGSRDFLKYLTENCAGTKHAAGTVLLRGLKFKDNVINLTTDSQDNISE